ncbi:dihydroorotase family protein [Candidatus Peregrinibacteria bacterium]|nr:dihydroorotase family protein [Candidatus Peregrinibacteria bacterium]
MSSTLIAGGTLVTSSGERLADILIKDGLIESIDGSGRLQSATAEERIDAKGKLIMPGLIDCHVHFREPGLTHKGDMQSESAAAVAGGVTTVCEMPNTIPPTVTVAALADKVRRAHAIKHCDIRFFMGVTEAAHLLAVRDVWIGSSAELKRLKKKCAGVKIYLDHSTGNQKIAGGVIHEVFKLCGELRIPLIAHCEDEKANAEAMKKIVGPKYFGPTIFPASLHSEARPPESEARAIEFAIGLARKYKTPFHVAHLSTAQGVDLVRRAKREGLAVTCEVAPHHLFLTTDDYKTLGTLAKMNPPLRSHEHQKALWNGIEDGTVDCIATDHAPHTIKEKQSGDPLKAPSGVPGVETMLPLLLTKLQPSNVVRLCFEHPNKIFNLGKKGITEGTPANLIMVDPKKEWTIEGKKLHSKCRWTPYEGWKVHGEISVIKD